MVFHEDGLIIWGGADDGDTVFKDIYYMKIGKYLMKIISSLD